MHDGRELPFEKTSWKLMLDSIALKTGCDRDMYDKKDDHTHLVVEYTTLTTSK